MEMHYTFHHELVKLNKKILKMGAMVEDRVRKAASTIQVYDELVIQKLKLSDYEIDDMEMEIEEDCLKILALYHPVASDLRFIVSVIKINKEIERIADASVSIAQRMESINKHRKGLPVPFDYSAMSEKAIQMLQKNGKGYFLMVEGGRIDHALHGTNAKRALEDTIAFDEAIRRALAMVTPRIR